MQGFFTPTEAGAVGTFAVLVLAIAKRSINFTGYVKSVTEALRGGGGSQVGYVLAVSPSVTFLKVYFGPTNFYYYF